MKLGWFKSVKIHFLMKGHTHCDVDQFFSVYAGELKKLNWTTPEQLLALIKSIYKMKVCLYINQCF